MKRYVPGIILLILLAVFEVLNFSITQFALLDLLGNIAFAGLRWATILSIVFCGIDFAGVARIFTPEQGRDEPAEVWYLFGAWFLGAVINAVISWWGISVALLAAGHLTLVIPVIVTAILLVIRVLLIGTFSLASDRLFTASK